MGKPGRPPRSAKNAASSASAGNAFSDDRSQRRETRSGPKSLVLNVGVSGSTAQHKGSNLGKGVEKSGIPATAATSSLAAAAAGGGGDAGPIPSGDALRGGGHDEVGREQESASAAPSNRRGRLPGGSRRPPAVVGGRSEGVPVQNGQGGTGELAAVTGLLQVDGGTLDVPATNAAAPDEVASSRGTLKRKDTRSGRQTSLVLRVKEQQQQQPPEVVELDNDDEDDEEERFVKAPSPKRARGKPPGRGRGRGKAPVAGRGGVGNGGGRSSREGGRAGRETGRDNPGRGVHDGGEDGAGPSSPERRLPRQRSPPAGQEITMFPAEPSHRYLGQHHEEGNEDMAKDAPFMDAVVKVFCVHTEPNFSLPWQRKRQYSSNSSGFIIGGKRVLTNAHSVEHHTQVKVKRRGSDTKYLASVLAIGTECDIAMLTVEDDGFWEGVEPLQFGLLPRLQDSVTVVGYPIGGDTISVTSGVVSRIEVTSYVHGAAELLGIQIDAAINSGNSGGPAFSSGGECVGIAFQSLKHEDAENIGYIIPTPVIKHFISDYERHNEFTGFPILGIEWQKMENPDLRKALGMSQSQKGVRVRRVEPTAPAAKVLAPSDIIVSFDGMKIANDGTVPFRHGERIGFSYLVSQKYTGERAVVEVLRNGSARKLNIELGGHTRLVPVHIRNQPPSYYIIAGFVFTAVTVPYLRSEYGKDYDYDAPVKLLDKLMHSMPNTPDEQVIVISQVLVADINIGYEEIVNTQVLTLNGTPVRNLKQLAQLVEACTDPFLQFDLEYQQLVVLDTQAAKAATRGILETHCIPSAMSEDLKARD